MGEDFSPTRQEPPQAAVAHWTRLRAQPPDKELFRSHTDVWQGEATQYGDRGPRENGVFVGRGGRNGAGAVLAARLGRSRAQFLPAKTVQTAFNGCEYRF